MSIHQRCTDLEAALSAYVDHEASPEDSAAVEAHVQSCAVCAARLQQYGRLAAQLDGQLRTLLTSAPRVAPRPPLPSAVYWPPRRSPRRLAAGALVALAVVAAVAVCVVLVRLVSSGLPLSSPTPPVAGAPGSGRVLVARLDGVLDPAEATYVQRVLEQATTEHGQAVVLDLEVAGGLDAAVGRIQQALAASPVPVVSYGPADAAVTLRLADASTLRAAAPGTSLAEQVRGLDGQTVQTMAGPVTLRTAGAPIESVEMEPSELLAHRLLDPTTAYLLFVLGLFAVLVEVAHPGALVPGLTGVFSLLLAVAAFGVLGPNPLGALLIVVAVALMAVDIRALGHGALSLVGSGCLVVGSLLLYAHWGGGPSLLPAVAIAPPVVVGVAGSGLLVGLGLVRVAGSVRRLPPMASTEPVVGARGVSRGALAPEGVVQVNGQLWSARLRAGELGPGQPVRVRARHGLVLEVEPATSVGAATQKGASR